MATSEVLVADHTFKGEPDHTVDEQLNRFRAAEAMKEAKTMADEGRVSEAHQHIARAKQVVQCSSAAKTEYCMQLQEDLVCAAEATKSAVSWKGEGQKRMNRMQTAHCYQRANDVELSEETTMYTNHMKASMRRKAKK